MLKYSIKMQCFVCFIITVASGLTTLSSDSVGVCYGMEADKLLPAKEVVDLYKTHRITKMRLYEPNYPILDYLRGSGIEVLLGIKEIDIREIAYHPHFAHLWIKENIRPYWPRVRIKYILVGNEAISGPNSRFIFPAMVNLNNELKIWSFSKYIKISTAVSSLTILRESTKPSAGSFPARLVRYMESITKFLICNKAPLFASVHPYFMAERKNATLRFSLFPSSNEVVMDGRFIYRNLFDSILDTLYVALEKVGGDNLSIVVSETGWPWRGQFNFATPQLADLYYTNIVNHVLSYRGTPRRPGRIQTYLYSLFDENKKPVRSMKRYWGIFNIDKKPNYRIVF